MFSNGYGLVIGVGGDLPVTKLDALALRKLLIDPNRAAYPEDQVEVLTEQAANKKGILDGFDRLITRANENPQSTVIVYYSGHGAKLDRGDSDSEYFLVPYGYDPGDVDTLVTGDELTDKIEALHAKKLLVLLDCCHAAGIPQLKARRQNLVRSPLPPELLKVLESGTGKVVVTSSRADEYSYTGEPYSIFTTCLLEALEGKGAIKQDGFSRILDVLIYLFNQVPERAAGPQHPYVKKVLDLDDNFPLCYYAGGSKQASLGIMSTTPPDLEKKLSPLRRKLLENELRGFEKSYSTVAAKIEKLRQAFIVKADTAVKFQLEHELLEAEAQLIIYLNKIEEIEQALG